MNIWLLFLKPINKNMIFLVLKSLLLNISGLTNNSMHINSFLYYFGHCDQVTILFDFLH